MQRTTPAGKPQLAHVEFRSRGIGFRVVWGLGLRLLCFRAVGIVGVLGFLAVGFVVWGLRLRVSGLGIYVRVRKGFSSVWSFKASMRCRARASSLHAD